MPDPSRSVRAPAGYVPEQAVSFTGAGGIATRVAASDPLPVRVGLVAAGSTPLAGNAAGSGSIGPFAPDLGRPIWLTLTGNWTGRAQVMRSTDGGVTLVPLTVGGQEWGVFTGNACEAVGEESAAGASWHLALTVQSGTIGYRVAQ